MSPNGGNQAISTHFYAMYLSTTLIATPSSSTRFQPSLMRCAGLAYLSESFGVNTTGARLSLSDLMRDIVRYGGYIGLMPLGEKVLLAITSQTMAMHNTSPSVSP